MNSTPARARPGLVNRTVRGLAFFAIVAGALAQLYLLLKQAITPELQSFAWPPGWIPHHITAAHLRSVLAVGELRSSMIRSVMIALESAASATVMGAMMGYAMARGAASRKVGMAAVTATRLLPMIAVALPLAVGLISVGLYDRPSGVGLALVHAALALPMTALVAYPAFVAIPHELEEAAFLDGASPLRIWVAVDLPLAR